MFSPSSRSASASATQSRRQVENFAYGDHSRAIARLAYRWINGLSYVW